jgi:hypothetical protein
MFRIAGSLFVASLGMDLLGRAIVITSAAALRTAAHLTLWAVRTTGVVVETASRLAASYLETRRVNAGYKMLSWSENQGKITVYRENHHGS